MAMTSAPESLRATLPLRFALRLGPFLQRPRQLHFSTWIGAPAVAKAFRRACNSHPPRFQHLPEAQILYTVLAGGFLGTKR